MKKVSIVIRTYNEEKYLEKLLQGINKQDYSKESIEIILVDSGSTDTTIAIAQKYCSKILHINKEDFSFGKSLNIGCAVATGDILVFVSGHCIPYENTWLKKLTEPFSNNEISYVYGRQIGGSSSFFSEKQIFKKYFPLENKSSQSGIYCNNANAALRRETWEKYKFDEELTGLEDMYLAKTLVNNGKKIAYEANAIVYHLHHENWTQIKRRFEREAIALQHIMPEVHVHFFDFLRYFVSAILYDYSDALTKKVLIKNLKNIFFYRLMQFWGTYRGNHFHRKFSKKMKESYFFPRSIHD